MHGFLACVRHASFAAAVDDVLPFQGIGFRNWKKRWFVLKGAELVCYKDGGLIETVGLRGCTIKRGKVGHSCQQPDRRVHNLEYGTRLF